MVSAGWKFRRQHAIGPYFADFACIEAALVVEIDGGQHQERTAQDRCKNARSWKSTDIESCVSGITMC
ncbi:MAG: DUF559 domain-containing protein [Comamonadaceae bacterium]|nr:DUF559 domain-containing protein [Comamonadaceae bacterium]